MCDESPFQQISAYTLTIEPYLNTVSKQYENIIVIDKMPLGPSRPTRISISCAPLVSLHLR